MHDSIVHVPCRQRTKHIFKILFPVSKKLFRYSAIPYSAFYRSLLGWWHHGAICGDETCTTNDTHCLWESVKRGIGNTILYRRFSAHTPPEGLLKLYLSFIRPHLEYAAPVLDPYCSSHVDALERVQKFALRMCFKNWNLEYQQLLVASKLQSLAVRRKYLKLCYLFQVLNGTFRFPDLPTSRSPIDSRLRSADPAQLHLQPIFARTRSYQQSFFPKTITLWNSIPAGIQWSTSIVEFKHKISVYL